MKNLIAQLAPTMGNDLTVERICLNFAVAFLLGAVVYISYRFSHSGAVYSARFNASLMMLTLITTLIMNVIGNNIALSLGMVGALSIVRFRTAIKDPRDSTYIFWCIAVGISCGVSYYALAAIGTGIIFLVMLGLGTVKANDRYLLVIHADTASTPLIEKEVMIQFEGRAQLRVRNQTRESTEHIYELSQKLIDRAKEHNKFPEASFLNIEGVEHVDLVCQNEEMSR